MRFANFGHVFVYDNTEQKTPILQNILSSGVYKTFTTSNVYQFLQYAGEITPNVMIFNLDDNNKYSRETLENFNRQISLTSCPIILTKPQIQPFSLHQRIAHYIHLPLETKKLIDIVESYCLGNKKHRIMLLNTYSPQYDKLHRSLDIGGYSNFYFLFFPYFLEFLITPYYIYLSKNNPQTVLIEYNPTLIAARHNLRHNRIFYVDRRQDITEIERFLN